MASTNNLVSNSNLIDASNKFNHYINEEEYGLTFVDFFPECLEPGGVFQSPIYADFRSTITTANEWLEKNPLCKVIKCETIKFKITNFKKVDYQNIVYVERGKENNYYLRGLRIWIVKNTDQNRARSQKLNYLDLSPKLIKEGSFFSGPEFENLDDMLKTYNELFQKEQFPGRILTIETQEIIIHNKLTQMDESLYNVGNSGTNHFFFILRVYYDDIIQEPQYVELGVMDFMPRIIEKAGILSDIKLESFSALVEKASTWCSEQRDIEICNIQSLEIKLINGDTLNTRKMNVSKHTETKISYVRVLRIPYLKYRFSEDFSTNLSSVRQLTYKNIIPSQLTSGSVTYENLTEVKCRISAWIKATGASVLSAETIAVKYNPLEVNIESCLTHSTVYNEFKVYVTKLYLKDCYSDPPTEMLPPVPEVQFKCCVIL